ncbi:hypothetical protein BSKO_09640 [Bryopsis sp. KO-2023]|nr:hypothetical protein BSKO_09640 [Bryopsis sp. KO-2023]
MLWAMIAITVLASTGNNIGKALQKQATATLPKLSLDSRTLRQYARSKQWLIGVAVDIGGGALMAVALGNAPVSIVQPVSSVGLVFLAMFSHFYLKERLEAQQWSSAAFCLLGTMGLGVAGDGASDTPQQPGLANKTVDQEETVPVRWVLGTLIFFAAALGLVSALRQKYHAGRGVGTKEGSVQNEGMLCGLEAGAYFGLSAAALRTGFIFSRLSMLWVPVGLGCSISLTSMGFVTQTQGLKDGNTVTVCTFANVAAMVTGVFVGLVALNEKMPTSPGLRVLRLASWALLALGVAASQSGGVKRLRKLFRSVSMGVMVFPNRVQAFFRRLKKRRQQSLPLQNPDANADSD